MQVWAVCMPRLLSCSPVLSESRAAVRAGVARRVPDAVLLPPGEDHFILYGWGAARPLPPWFVHWSKKRKRSPAVQEELEVRGWVGGGQQCLEASSSRHG